MNIDNVRSGLLSGQFDEELQRLYVDKSLLLSQRERFCKALDTFSTLFPFHEEIELYSAAGRSEVCGNHTDHQKGKVLAASINLDAIAVVSKTEDDMITLQSEGMPVEVINVKEVEKVASEEGTTSALIKGVVKGLLDRGYKVGGFFAYVTSNVLMGAGLSSSAAFEGLVGVILSGLYNDNQISSTEIAQISQYAENVYFGKPCGLMDQMACDTGDMITIDFEKDGAPIMKQIATRFEEQQISLCIIDTKGSHADLTDDYAAVPKEMKAVAAYFGKEVLREVAEDDFYGQIAKVREATSDRAVLRAIHFFEEEKRVEKAVQALEENDYEEFLRQIKESGASSMRCLQNIYSPKNPLVQNVTVALSLAEHYLSGGKGVCRVHGGGFAGTIQAFVRNASVQEFKEAMEKTFGEGSCHILKVRPVGAVKIL